MRTQIKVEVYNFDTNKKSYCKNNISLTTPRIQSYIILDYIFLIKKKMHTTTIFLNFNIRFCFNIIHVFFFFWGELF